ncbi:MAG: hypothetical protein IJV31_00915 [Clostridia bacterium]|nr:hypothetical protein [Clostridia bacterium]MBQ9657312.1 hypothetical protein [Clostridia bacterium]
MSKRGRPPKIDISLSDVQSNPRPRGRPPKDKTAKIMMSCACCGEDNDINEYYDSDSILYKAKGKLPYCKDCINKIYDEYLKECQNREYKNPDKKATQRICMSFDLYYSDDLYENAMTEFTKKNDNSKNELSFMPYYFRHVKLLQYKTKDYNDTIFKDYQDIKKKQKLMSSFNDDDFNQEAIVTKASKFFGSGLNSDDYVFLQNEYDDWTSRHECQTKAQEEVFKAICFNRWKAHKANIAGEDTKDLDRTFKDLLDTGKLQPKQSKENDILSTDKRTLGEMAEIWEDTILKPIPTPQGHLADIDHIGELDGFIRGHTCKAVGIQNFYSETYSKLMKQFTVNKPQYEDDYDSETSFDNIFGGIGGNSNSEE